MLNRNKILEKDDRREHLNFFDAINYLQEIHISSKSRYIKDNTVALLYGLYSPRNFEKRESNREQEKIRCTVGLRKVYNNKNYVGNRNVNKIR